MDAEADKTNISVEEWLATRKKAALTIDPETAEVMWTYAASFDPYGVYPDPPEGYTVGREYFARAPGSELWVWFGDLPGDLSRRLWDLHRSRLAFPAGLPNEQEIRKRIGTLMIEVRTQRGRPLTR